MTKILDRERSIEKVRTLKDAGLNGVQISDATGLSRSYVYELLNDPDGQIAVERKKRCYGRPCKECGKQLNPGGRNKGFTQFCSDCLNRQNGKAGRKRLIAEMQRFHEEFGRPPSAIDWNAAHSRNIGRPVTEGNWPPAGSVQQHFGSWSAGLVAAGFKPNKRGGNNGGPGSLSEQELLRTARLQAELGTVRAASALGVTPSAVCMRLRKLKEGQMAPSVKPVVVIEREIEKTQARIKVLEEQKREAENDLEQLRQAKVALNGLFACTEVEVPDFEEMEAQRAD